MVSPCGQFVGSRPSQGSSFISSYISCYRSLVKLNVRIQAFGYVRLVFCNQVLGSLIYSKINFFTSRSGWYAHFALSTPYDDFCQISASSDPLTSEPANQTTELPNSEQPCCDIVEIMTPIKSSNSANPPGFVRLTIGDVVRRAFRLAGALQTLRSHVSTPQGGKLSNVRTSIAAGLNRFSSLLQNPRYHKIRVENRTRSLHHTDVVR